MKLYCKFVFIRRSDACRKRYRRKHSRRSSTRRTPGTRGSPRRSSSSNRNSLSWLSSRLSSVSSSSTSRWSVMFSFTFVLASTIYPFESRVTTYLVMICSDFQGILEDKRKALLQLLLQLLEERDKRERELHERLVSLFCLLSCSRKLLLVLFLLILFFPHVCCISILK